MSTNRRIKHQELSGIMQDNLKNLSSQMVKIKQKNGKNSARHQSEFETIPEVLSSTDRAERNRRMQSKVGLVTPEKEQMMHNAHKNYESDKYDPLFPEYTEYNMEIDTGNPDSRQIYRLEEDPEESQDVSESVQDPYFNEDEKDYEVQKDNYYQEKAINPNEFFPKPFVVISCNNKLETGNNEEGYEDISVQSILDAEAEELFSPNRKLHESKAQALEQLAEKNDELNPAFKTYQTHVQSNYKSILLQNTYGDLKDFPDEDAKCESPSRAFVKYNQYLSSKENKKAKKVDKENHQDERELAPFSYPDYKKTPVRLKTPGKSAKTPVSGKKGMGSITKKGDGYGDSIDDVNQRMQKIVRQLYFDEIRRDKRKFVAVLKNLDKFFKSQFQQVLRINAELKNFSQLIKRKNKNLEVVLDTIDVEAEKLESNLKLITRDTKRLNNLIEDKDYYEEMGHKKIQKMNELDELRRVVKDLNRRYEEKKRELRDKKRVTSNFQRLYQQVQSTFSSNNKMLKKALRSGKKQGRIRDMVNRRSFSSNASSLAKKKKKLGLRIRNRPKTTKKKRNSSRTSKGYSSYKKRKYGGPFLHLEEERQKDKTKLRKGFNETQRKLMKTEDELREQGIRLYPIDDDFAKNMKRPVNNLNNHNPVIKTILRQELLYDQRQVVMNGDNEVYSSHKNGPIVRNHVVNNPVSYHEKKMRSKVLKAMNI